MNKIIQEDIHNILDSDLDYSQFKGKIFYLTGSTGMIGRFIKLFLEYINAIVITKESELIYQDIDYIIHAASPASSELFVNPVDVFKCNVIETNRLIEKIKGNNALKGFMFLSSGEALNPVNCYGEAKRSTERLLRYYSDQYNIPTYSVRLDHTFGPTMRLEKDKRIFAYIVKQILNNEQINIENPSSVRTFTYITDALDGIFRTLLKGTSGEVYNIGNPKNKTTLHGLALELSLIYCDIEFVEGFDEKATIKESLDIEPLRQLGFDPAIGTLEAFHRTIKSFKQEE